MYNVTSGLLYFGVVSYSAFIKCMKLVTIFANYFCLGFTDVNLEK